MGIQADGLGFRVDTHGSDKNELIGVSLMGVLKRLWAERMWVRRRCRLKEAQDQECDEEWVGLEKLSDIREECVRPYTIKFPEGIFLKEGRPTVEEDEGNLAFVDCGVANFKLRKGKKKGQPTLSILLFLFLGLSLFFGEALQSGGCG